MKTYSGVDISGTKIIVISSDGQKVLHKRRFERTESSKKDVENISAAIHELCEHKPRAIGTSCGSPLDWKRGIVTAPLHLPTWRNVPLRNIMEKEFGCPFFIDNDTNLAALAVHHRELKAQYNNVVYMHMSTGVGGGIILNGKVHRGIDGEHPEIGHQNIRHTFESDIACPCGGLNCLEAIISGRGIRTLYKKRPEDLDTAEIHQVGVHLGRGLANIIALYNPDIIVLGGRILIERQNELLPVAKEQVQKHCHIVPTPEIKVTTMDEDMYALGAVILAQRGFDG